MLRSHDGQLLLNNNNVENNFYLSSNHNEYKFNPNILTQQNQQQVQVYTLIKQVQE